VQETGWNREQFVQSVKQALFHEPEVILRLCVPALLYTVQNNLQYLALSNLTAAAYQVLSQLKIFTTAVLSVMFLGKSLSQSQWFALVLLMLGVCVVQYQASQSGSSSNMTGFFAVVAATSTSGFCAVYLETVLKAKGSIWVRNIQMAIIGLASSSLAAVLQDGSNISELGFFHGYTSIVWMVILLNAGGGLIVALVVKYADNILKGFATSVSIIVSCVASALLADFVVTTRFVAGAVLVLVAVGLYTVQDLKHRPEKQVPSKV
jgi:UDP-sugar transporter A1/2/3